MIATLLMAGVTATPKVPQYEVHVFRNLRNVIIGNISPTGKVIGRDHRGPLNWIYSWDSSKKELVQTGVSERMEATIMRTLHFFPNGRLWTGSALLDENFKTIVKTTEKEFIVATNSLGHYVSRVGREHLLVAEGRRISLTGFVQSWGHQVIGSVAMSDQGLIAIATVRSGQTKFPDGTTAPFTSNHLLIFNYMAANPPVNTFDFPPTISGSPPEMFFDSGSRLIYDAMYGSPPVILEKSQFLRIAAPDGHFAMLRSGNREVSVGDISKHVRMADGSRSLGLPSVTHATIWVERRPYALRDRVVNIPADTHLYSAGGINEAGVITGMAYVKGELVPFIAEPLP